MNTVMLLIILGLVSFGLYVQLRKSNPASKKANSLIVDSCALIDARILELVRARFLPFKIIIPKQVLDELQLLADGQDAHKRERARFGLDIVKQLQQTVADVTIGDQVPERGVPTDEQLVRLARTSDAYLFTTDFNLQQIASIQDVMVLNPNELSMLLRPTALPGDHKQVKIVQKGSGRDQGVGYLDDGTMVVIDNAARAIGRTLEVEVTRSHQTASGKMMFAEPLRKQAPMPKLRPRPATKTN